LGLLGLQLCLLLLGNGLLLGVSNSVLDVVGKSGVGNLQQLLLGLGDVGDGVGGLGDTLSLYMLLAVFRKPQIGLAYSKLNGDGKVLELSSNGGLNLLSSGNTGKIDESGLDNVLLSLVGLEDGLSEAESGVSHGEGGGSGTGLGLDNLVSSELDACYGSVSEFKAIEV
jgi:hypothetical protein